MNATDTIDPPPGLTLLQPAAVTDHGQSPPSTLDSQPQTTPQRQYRKIAKLPKPLRDLINSMLDDAFTAREIIARLEASNDPPLPYPISEVNISDWKNGGYHRHLAQQERLALVQINREGAQEILGADDITTLPEATLQIVASQYYDVLGDFSPESLKQKLAEDPLKYTRVLNVFSRLVREIVHLKKYRDTAAKTRAAEIKKLDPDRDLSEQEFDLLVSKMDKVFKVARPGLSPAQTQSAPVAQPSPPVELQTPIQNQKPELALARESQIEIQNSKIPQAPNLRHSSPSPDPSPLAPRPSDAHSNSDGGLAHEAGIACSPIQNQNSKIQNQNDSQLSTLNSQLIHEHCLQCGHPLPPLLPSGVRPEKRCPECEILLPPPGSCAEPPNEQCRVCGANLPRLLPNGQRPDPYCHNCGTPLLTPDEPQKPKTQLTAPTGHELALPQKSKIPTAPASPPGPPILRPEPHNPQCQHPDDQESKFKTQKSSGPGASCA